ncbi:MAG TPA: DNA primase small subunit domain-containing protein, partial [Actinomycetota bacterium]
MSEVEILEVAGKDVRVTSTGKVLFPQRGITKLDLVRYYLSVGEGAVRGARDRPVILHRFPHGIDDEDFYQKRVQKGSAGWLVTARIAFPSGRTAEELVIADEAHLAWMINLGCIDINPWPVRAGDLDHPDELRVDLDPTPGIPWGHVREVALLAREVLEEHGLAGYVKTSGKRGIHVLVRIEPRWTFTAVRRAALALAREVERRDARATTAWWKEERTGVFVDYNQNARDRTVASAYSVRPVPDARVSAPLTWDEVPDVEPEDLTIDSVPGRYAEIGDPHEPIDDRPGSLDPLLELAERDRRGGLGDAPWPPHFPKGDDEPVRAAPSRR